MTYRTFIGAQKKHSKVPTTATTVTIWNSQKIDDLRYNSNFEGNENHSQYITKDNYHAEATLFSMVIDYDCNRDKSAALINKPCN